MGRRGWFQNTLTGNGRTVGEAWQRGGALQLVPWRCGKRGRCGPHGRRGIKGRGKDLQGGQSSSGLVHSAQRRGEASHGQKGALLQQGLGGLSHTVTRRQQEPPAHRQRQRLWQRRGELGQLGCRGCPTCRPPRWTACYPRCSACSPACRPWPGCPQSCRRVPRRCCRRRSASC